MEATFLSELAANFGPLVGIVLFFIWRDWKREDALLQRVSKLEDYQRETLVNLVERSTAALSQNAECLKWVCRVMERFCGDCPLVDDYPKAPSGVSDERNES